MALIKKSDKTIPDKDNEKQIRKTVYVWSNQTEPDPKIIAPKGDPPEHNKPPTRRRKSK